MRNLIGRLNAREPVDLNAIAAAWQVPVTATERAAIVAQIVRTLTDLRAVRDAWHALDDDARTLIGTLAEGRESRNVADLADALGWTPEDVDATAERLFRTGWIARDGDNRQLKLSETPGIFVPLELAHSVRRVLAEMTVGDRSAITLPELLTELDTIELEEAAQHWGTPVVAGLRTREELIALITDATTGPEAIGRVTARLSRDARAIFDHVREHPAGVPLEDALREVGLEPRSGPAQTRVRAALGQLERSLLTWHSYDWKGDRRLFVPEEIRSPPERVSPQPPAPISLADTGAPPPTHYRLAWDVLTLLRALSSPDPPRTRMGDHFPISFLERLNRRLFVRGQETPPAGYVPFLTALAVAEGLIVPEAERGVMVVTPDIRRWRDRSFDDQDARLRWRWLTAIEWIEGADQTETRVWGADWRGMRRQILKTIAEIDDFAWRPLDQFVTWVFEREPALLGRAYTVAVGVGITEEGAEARRLAARTVVSLTIRRAFVWLGLVEILRAAAHGHVVRVTPRGRAVATGSSLEPPVTSATLTVGNDGVISLTEPTPLQVWSVSAFTDPIELGPTATYRLTARSIERAIEAGFQSHQIARFLERQSGQALPGAVAELLEKEQRDHPVVSFQGATLITPSSPDAREQLLRVLKASGIEVTELDGALIVRADAATGDRLATILRSAGLVVRGESR